MKQLSALCDSLATSSAARTTSGKIPFTPTVAAEILPARMKILFLEHYDGSTNPEDHLAQYQAVMQLHGFSDAIWCKTFATTLKGAART